jgi:hypothetical protein
MPLAARGRGLTASLVAGLAALALSVALLLSTAGPAHAIYKPFCWNVTLTGTGFPAGECDMYYHDGGSVPYVTEVGGTGFQHSVCVYARFSGVHQCSGGPGQGVYNFTPDGTVGPGNWGKIENNAAGSNTVQAFVDYCNNPC